MSQDKIVDQIRNRGPARTYDLEMAITLGKIDLVCQTELDDDEDPISDEARSILIEIQRMVNHRDLTEARALLQLRGKIRALVDAYAGSYHLPGDDLYAELVEILNEEAQ